MLCRPLARCRYKGSKWRLTLFLVFANVILYLCNMSYTTNNYHVSKAAVLVNERSHFNTTQQEHSNDLINSTQIFVNDIKTAPTLYHQLDERLQEFIPEGFRKGGDIEYNYSSSYKQPGPGFTLITMLNLFTGQSVEGYEKETKESLIKRNSEYLAVVRENMNHPSLKRIILFYTDINSMKVLLSQNWENITKIYPVKMDRLLHMADYFNFSSRYLLDEPVIGSNGDIIIGEHFENIDTVRMRDSQTLYSLTRHGNKGFGDCEAKSMCLMPYFGSHDTHIFRLKNPVSNAALKILDYPVNLQQAENGMIGTMIKLLGFKVFNPCLVLTTYHVHCSRIGKRLVKGKDSIKNAPWSVKNMKTAAPVKQLMYAK